MIARTRLKGLLRVGGLALLWGSGFMWIKIALEAMSPLQITLTRLALGAAVLSIIVYVIRQRLPSGATVWAHLLIAALFANAAPYLLFAIGEQIVASSVAGIINSTTPLWTTILAYAVGRDHLINRLKLIGLIIGFVGTLLIFSPWSESNDIASWGGLACLAASLCYAISYIYMSRYLVHRGLPPLVLSAAQLAAASGILLVAAPLDGWHPITLSPGVLTAVSILGVFGTGIAYVLNYHIIHDDGPVLASTVTYLLPVVAILLGWLVLAEVPNGSAVAGTALVLVGVAATRFGRDNATEATRDGQQGWQTGTEGRTSSAGPTEIR